MTARPFTNQQIREICAGLRLARQYSDAQHVDEAEAADVIENLWREVGALRAAVRQVGEFYDLLESEVGDQQLSDDYNLGKAAAYNDVRSHLSDALKDVTR